MAPRRQRLQRLSTTAARFAEVGFLVSCLFLFSGALLPLLLSKSGMTVMPAHGNPILRATYAGIHAITLVLVLARWRSVAAVVKENLPIAGLVGLALLSVAWSDAPDVTLRRSFSLFGTSAFGLYLAARFGIGGTLRLLGLAMGVAAALSLVVAVGLPGYGLDEGAHAGAWRGVFHQKNNLGQAMVMSTVAFVLLWRIVERRRWAALLGAVLSAGLVLLSTSGTALVILLCFAALLPLFRVLRWHHTVVLPLLILIVLVAGLSGLWVVSNVEMVLNLLGKDATLTGRTELWTAVIHQIQQRPVLGYGYSAFWLGWTGASAAVWSMIRWETPHAHNGFLDLGLDLGLLGIALFVTGYVMAAVRAMAAIRGTRSTEALWPPALLSFMLLYNFTETAILQQNSIYWVLFVATVFSIAPDPRPSEANVLAEDAARGAPPSASHLSPGIRRRLGKKVGSTAFPVSS